MRARIPALVAMLLVLPFLVVATSSTGAVARADRTITLTVFPAPIGQTKAGTQNRTRFWGQVKPARKGARVLLQRKTKKGVWKTIRRVTQDRSGRFRGYYKAWPRSQEVLRVRSRPGHTRKTISSPIKRRHTWPMKFNENFWGSRLNTKRWRHRLQPMGGTRPCAQPRANRVKVRNGVATLSVRRIARRCAASAKNKSKGKYANAMIGTKEKFRFKHGVFAARVKFPRPEGMHGGFWLQGPVRTGAEVDIAEWFGATSPSNLSIFVHHTNRSGGVKSRGMRGGELPTRRVLGRTRTPYNSYHVYAVHWNAKRYQFWLDGKKMWTTRRPHVSTAPEEIVLSLLTSDWEVGRLKSTKPVMRVDWVRVWQAK